MRTAKVYPQIFTLHSPFVIARGVRNSASVVVVEIEEDGLCGTGECTPYPRYGECEASVIAQIESILPRIREGITRLSLQSLMPAGAARNAVDSALWSLEAAQAGTTVAGLAGVTLPERITTAQTVSIDTPQQMAAAARALWLKGASLLKIKLDDTLVRERTDAIRQAVPEAQLIVDANESWRPETLQARCQHLADLGVMMLEQPLPAHHDEVLAQFTHPLAVCADESCHTRASLAALSGRYEMINIKLDKTGGLTEALELARVAGAQGFGIMAGCMLCSSRAIAAVLPVAVGARFADLDGPTWLQTDVRPGLHFVPGGIRL